MLQGLSEQDCLLPGRKPARKHPGSRLGPFSDSALQTTIQLYCPGYRVIQAFPIPSEEKSTG